MNAAFADAFYFVALVNRADQHHARALAAAQNLRENVVTTEWILAEFADALAESAAGSFDRSLAIWSRIRKCELSGPAHNCSSAGSNFMTSARIKSGPLRIVSHSS